jgi:hypothetical protein
LTLDVSSSNGEGRTKPELAHPFAVEESMVNAFRSLVTPRAKRVTHNTSIKHIRFYGYGIVKNTPDEVNLFRGEL